MNGSSWQVTMHRDSLTAEEQIKLQMGTNLHEVFSVHSLLASML